MKPAENFDLSSFATFGIGGLARWSVEAESVAELDQAVRWARENKTRFLFVGEGSNILFSDEGFDGLLIINRMAGVQVVESAALPEISLPDAQPGPRAHALVRAGGGMNLMDLIRWANRNGLAGLEKMYGIPGSVAGAVVGNAGAYGQEIRDSLIEATIWNTGQTVRMSGADLGFSYRHSVLKDRRDWFLVDCTLKLRRSTEDLQRISDEILATRTKKYPPGLKCPGSFFKNVEASKLPPEILGRIPPDFIMHGKIPAGKLLEDVGACGARRGDILVATYHGNLFMNLGSGSSADVLSLAGEYADRVREKFGIHLEPEVLIVDGDSDFAVLEE